VRESNGFIPIGLMFGCVTNLSGCRTTNSAVDRVERVWTVNQVCPDSSHWKAEIREKFTEK
jgi:hypothetical protein